MTLEIQIEHYLPGLSAGCNALAEPMSGLPAGSISRGRVALESEAKQRLTALIGATLQRYGHI